MQLRAFCWGLLHTKSISTYYNMQRGQNVSHNRTQPAAMRCFHTQKRFTATNHCKLLCSSFGASCCSRPATTLQQLPNATAKAAHLQQQKYGSLKFHLPSQIRQATANMQFATAKQIIATKTPTAAMHCTAAKFHSTASRNTNDRATLPVQTHRQAPGQPVAAGSV